MPVKNKMSPIAKLSVVLGVACIGLFIFGATRPPNYPAPSAPITAPPPSPPPAAEKPNMFVTGCAQEVYRQYPGVDVTWSDDFFKRSFGIDEVPTILLLLADEVQFGAGRYMNISCAIDLKNGRVVKLDVKPTTPGAPWVHHSQPAQPSSPPPSPPPSTSDDALLPPG